MELPFIPCVLPLMSILVVLLGGVASACGVLPGGTVVDTVDDVLILMMEAVRLCVPYEAMSESFQNQGDGLLLCVMRAKLESV